MRHPLRIALLLTLLPPAALQGQEGSEPPLSTFSIVACDAEEGFLGVAIQSRVVGAGAIVPAAEAGVGAIATQAAANVAFKADGLRLLREGLSPTEVAERFRATDPGIENRQFAVIGLGCDVTAFTGDETLSWAGHRTGAGYSVQGNILTGPEVLDAMATAYEQAERDGHPFPERLLASLKAGQEAGGDRRGRQGAGILVVREGAGYGGGDDRYVDLRVEDHVEPILELERVYGVWMRLFHPADHFLPAGSEPIAAPRGPHVCLLREMLAAAGHGTAPEEGQSACWLDAMTIEALQAFQRAEGLPERPALDRETAARLRSAATAP
jgi:uncharacterized Ntn-hydrolase superfamily protein